MRESMSSVAIGVALDNLSVKHVYTRTHAQWNDQRILTLPKGTNDEDFHSHA